MNMDEFTVPTSEDIDLRYIDEEYKIWKKNTPFLYDLVMSQSLEWPSLTLQWLPDFQISKDKTYSVHKLIHGTHTADGEQNYLSIAEVYLPMNNAEIDVRKYDDETQEIGGFGGNLHSKIETRVKILHDGEVNRARYMPQDPFFIATKSPKGCVNLFDVSKHPSLPTSPIPFPQEVCTGHVEGQDGYGLSWNPNVRGRLLSASDDGIILLIDWNCTSSSSSSSTISRTANHVIKTGSVVEDVNWHKFRDYMFGSCGDDCAVHLWDTRELTDIPMSSIPNAHDGFINGIDFSPKNPELFITASADSSAKLWDLRQMSSPVHVFRGGHREAVLQAVWSPFAENVFCTSSVDRRVMVWDIGRAGMEMSEEDRLDGPPELMFIHGGHTSRVSDISWNMSPSYEYTLASTAGDNVLQVWQMAENIYNEKYVNSQPSIAQAARREEEDEDHVLKRPRI